MLVCKHLCICGFILFNDPVNNSDCTASNGQVTNEVSWFKVDPTIPVCVWRCEENHEASQLW